MTKAPAEAYWLNNVCHTKCEPIKNNLEVWTQFNFGLNYLDHLKSTNVA